MQIVKNKNDFILSQTFQKDFLSLNPFPILTPKNVFLLTLSILVTPKCIL